MTSYAEINLRTQQRDQLVDITGNVRQVLEDAGIRNGICAITSLHTTAGITINENADPSVGRDILWKLGQLVPRNDAYHHGEGNSDSHLKASLMGPAVSVAVRNGALVLGRWQAVYFCEFDGPRARRVGISVVGE